jgi:integrase
MQRKGRPDCWVFRWREHGPGGARVQRKCVVGTVEEYPTASEAQKAVGALRITINQEFPRDQLHPISVAELIAHYKQTELSDDPNATAKAFATRKVYGIFLDTWVTPRWGSLKLAEVRTVAVERWLKQLARADGQPLANGTKSKIRNLMSVLFNHAIRYEWLRQGGNPITHVRQSAKRKFIPDVLDARELRALLARLPSRDRALVALDAITGLRRSELMALKWRDIDFAGLQINVTRSVYNQVVGSCKTEASRKPVPLDPALARELLSWRDSAPYIAPEDWVFASPQMKGRQPYWPDTILKRSIRPAALAAGISKRIGWHTFRHSFSTMLRARGVDVKVMQELLRHANSRITLDIYTQAPSLAKRQAQTGVAREVLAGPLAPAPGRILELFPLTCPSVPSAVGSISGKPLRNMVGTWGLEPQTSTVSR